VGQQRGVRGRFQVSGRLQGDTVLQVAQQRVRQAEHTGSIRPIGIHGYAEQEPDDQADPADGQADAQQGKSPPGSLRQRVNVDINDVQTIGQSAGPLFWWWFARAALGCQAPVTDAAGERQATLQQQQVL
jgi:hypothetical protein